MKYYDIFYQDINRETLNPFFEEDATEAATTATAEELEAAKAAMLCDYYHIIDEIAALKAEIEEKQKLIRANNKIDKIITNELERREAAESGNP